MPYHIVFKRQAGHWKGHDWEERFTLTKPRLKNKVVGNVASNYSDDRFPFYENWKWRVTDIKSGRVVASNLDVREEAEYATTTWPMLEEYKRTGIDPRLDERRESLQNRIQWAKIDIHRLHDTIAKRERNIARMEATLRKVNTQLSAPPSPVETKQVA